MDCNAFSFYSNVFGIIVGSTSLIVLAFGFHLHLPTNKMKTLDVLLDETDKILRSVLEEGLLSQQRFGRSVEYRFSSLQKQSMDLRSRVYCVTTWAQDCKGFVQGVSADIGRTCYELKMLRAEVITASEAARRNLCAVGDATTSSTTPSSPTISSLDYTSATTDYTENDASSIVTSTLKECTLSRSCQCNHKTESFVTAEAISDVAADLSAQPMGHVRPDWKRIWEHGNRYIKPEIRDYGHEVKVELVHIV
ncbi:hypothetical protein F5I97DRAFT_1922604 [Phlebopus sp. FC_14]|nr:hypothetical protein F5I97DRAFT_1922604 [Phlebopus sp. FC_14]